MTSTSLMASEEDPWLEQSNKLRFVALLWTNDKVILYQVLCRRGAGSTVGKYDSVAAATFGIVAAILRFVVGGIYLRSFVKLCC